MIPNTITYVLNGYNYLDKSGWYDLSIMKPAWSITYGPQVMRPF